MELYVQTQWNATCSKVGVTNDMAAKWWKYIATRYSEEQRRYHTLQHVHDMLLDVASCKHLLSSPSDVILAVFFHDVIYDPKATDNEDQSALVFKKFADECLKKDGDASDVVGVEHVFEMIMLTKSHQTEEHLSKDSFGTEDRHYLLDIDMAILGQESNVYDSYAENIRKEYSHIRDEEYCTRRAQVLKNIMKAPKIYTTEKWFHCGYEERARTNLSREITRLEAASKH